MFVCVYMWFIFDYFQIGIVMFFVTTPTDMAKPFYLGLDLSILQASYILVECFNKPVTLHKL